MLVVAWMWGCGCGRIGCRFLWLWFVDSDVDVYMNWKCMFMLTWMVGGGWCTFYVDVAVLC